MPQKKNIRVFGRITASQLQCEDILNLFFLNSPYILACYEEPDSGCSSAHCHFIASSDDYSSINSLRNQFSALVLKNLKLPGKYSLKLEDTEQDAVAYICKDITGHKKFCCNEKHHCKTVPVNIFLNKDKNNFPTMTFDIGEAHRRYWTTFSELKASKSIKNTWKAVVDYIEQNDSEIFNKPLRKTTHIKIASYLYDWYVENERVIQGKYVQQTIINTIIVQKYNSKTLKKSLVMDWCSELSYFNGMEQTFDSECLQDFDDL